VYFLVLFSIIVHGLSIPALSLIYKYTGVKPITDDAVEIERRSIYVPTPSNAINGQSNTFIAYNRFFRPYANLATTLPFVRSYTNFSIPEDEAKLRGIRRSPSITEVEVAGDGSESGR
jgi:sodium/hydrogen antiporter